MSDFNYRRSRDTGSYPDSQYANYDYPGRWMESMDMHNHQRYLETSRNYNYMNHQNNNYERHWMSDNGFQCDRMPHHVDHFQNCIIPNNYDRQRMHNIFNQINSWPNNNLIDSAFPGDHSFPRNTVNNITNRVPPPSFKIPSQVPSVIPNLSNITDQDLSVIRNIIQTVNTAKTTSGETTTPTTTLKQSTSNISQPLKDSTHDEYAPIISSSKKASVGAAFNKSLVKSIFITSGLGVLSDNTNISTNMRDISTTTKDQTQDGISKKNRPFDGRERCDRSHDSRCKGDMSHDSRYLGARTHGNRSGRHISQNRETAHARRSGSGPRSTGFEKNRATTTRKRQFGDEWSKNNIPNKRMRVDDGAYDDGWNDIRKENVIFKDLFPIQAQKIDALMLRVDTLIEIPNLSKEAGNEDPEKLANEEMLDKEFQQRRQELQKIAEQKTARKREKRRKRKANTRLLVKNFLGS